MNVIKLTLVHWEDLLVQDRRPNSDTSIILCMSLGRRNTPLLVCDVQSITQKLPLPNYGFLNIILTYRRYKD